MKCDYCKSEIQRFHKYYTVKYGKRIINHFCEISCMSLYYDEQIKEREEQEILE